MLSSLPQLKTLGVGLQGHYSRYVPPKYSYLYSKLHGATDQNFIKNCVLTTNIRLQLVHICKTADDIHLKCYIQSELPVEKYPSIQ
jgi:hypothetical protein